MCPHDSLSALYYLVESLLGRVSIKEKDKSRIDYVIATSPHRASEIVIVGSIRGDI